MATKFVLYYAEWCPYCIAMQPAWKSLHSIVPKNVILSEIEAANVTPDMKIKSYPTMVLFTNRRKKLEYNGERTPEKMQEFIKQHAPLHALGKTMRRKTDKTLKIKAKTPKAPKTPKVKTRRKK